MVVSGAVMGQAVAMRLRVALAVVVVAVGAAGCSDGGPAEAVAACPGTTHSFERPAVAGESGDGLPATGTATRQAAADVEEEVKGRYRATDSAIVEIDGRAWRRTPAGDVEIIPERIFTIRLTLADRGSCPDAPTVAGVPVDFVYPSG